MALDACGLIIQGNTLVTLSSRLTAILQKKSFTIVLSLYKVTETPWSDDVIQEETMLIADKLAAVNRCGVLTTNSQPNVNGVSSTDPVFGWGNTSGYIYQKVPTFLSVHQCYCCYEWKTFWKWCSLWIWRSHAISALQAYLEFFTSKENVEILKEILAYNPQVNYHILSCKVRS